MDIYEFLQGENKKILYTLKKLEDAASHEPGEREALMEEAGKRILVQNRIEDEYLFPFLRSDSKTAPVVDSFEDENRETEELLKELRHMSKTDKRFAFLAERLHGQILQHARREHDELFPQLRQVVPDDQARLLGDRIEERRLELFETG